MMPSVAENENNSETSPAQNGFNKLMVKTATARELSGSAWRPRRMPKSKMSCIMPPAHHRGQKAPRRTVKRPRKHRGNERGRAAFQTEQTQKTEGELR